MGVQGCGRLSSSRMVHVGTDYWLLRKMEPVSDAAAEPNTLLIILLIICMGPSSLGCKFGCLEGSM